MNCYWLGEYIIIIEEHRNEWLTRQPLNHSDGNLLERIYGGAIVDLSLLFWSGGVYFFWRWSGFITLGLTYVMMTILEKEPIQIKIEGEGK